MTTTTTTITTTGYGLKFAIAFSLTPVLYFLKNILTENFGLQPIPVDNNNNNNNNDDNITEN